MARYVVTPVDRAPYEAGLLSATRHGQIFTSTDLNAQLHGLFDHPLAIAGLPLTTLLHDPWLPRQFMGIFGWLNVFLPDASYWALEFSLATAVLSELLLRKQEGPDRRRVLLYVAAAICAIWAIYIVQYLTWTNVGQSKIDGVSGRYFLPLLPLLALAIPHVARLNWPRWLLACEFIVIGGCSPERRRSGHYRLRGVLRPDLSRSVLAGPLKRFCRRGPSGQRRIAASGLVGLVMRPSCATGCNNVPQTTIQRSSAPVR